MKKSMQTPVTKGTSKSFKSQKGTKKMMKSVLPPVAKGPGKATKSNGKTKTGSPTGSGCLKGEKSSGAPISVAYFKSSKNQEKPSKGCWDRHSSKGAPSMAPRKSKGIFTPASKKTTKSAQVMPKPDKVPMTPGNATAHTSKPISGQGQGMLKGNDQMKKSSPMAPLKAQAPKPTSPMQAMVEVKELQGTPATTNAVDAQKSSDPVSDAAPRTSAAPAPTTVTPGPHQRDARSWDNAGSPAGIVNGDVGGGRLPNVTHSGGDGPADPTSSSSPAPWWAIFVLGGLTVVGWYMVATYKRRRRHPSDDNEDDDVKVSELSKPPPVVERLVPTLRSVGGGPAAPAVGSMNNTHRQAVGSNDER